MHKKNLNTELWVDRYGDIMYRYTLVRVRDADSAEEIVQNTFVAALRSSQSFEGRSTEKTWLFGILKNKIFDHFRQAKKYMSFDSLPECEPDSSAYQLNGQWKKVPQDWRIDPEKVAENVELAQVLAGCMEKLSDKFHKIFVLKEVEGYSSNKICNDFNITPTNLWVILHRTRNQLKKCLETHWINKA